MIGFFNYTVILTYLSALSAAVGITFAMHGKGFGAILCLMFSGVCDMFDGLVARTKERSSQEKRFGIWIDSLADIVAFGVLPAAIGYAFGLRKFYYIFILSVYILAALIRLAYYGVTEEDRQQESSGVRTSFLGLPVTSSALIFPLLYCFKGLLAAYFPPVYALVMALTALAFVLRVRVKKCMLGGMLVMLAMGIAIFVALVILRVR